MALVQGRCLNLSSGPILVPLSTGSTAYVTDVVGALSCPNSAPPATSESYNGQGWNIPVLTATPVVPGLVWEAELLPLGHAAPGLVFFLLRGASLEPGPVVSLNGGPPTELLVTGGVYADFVRSHQGESAAPASLEVPLPADLSLLGTPWALQAGVTSQYIDLSNGVRGVVGS